MCFSHIREQGERGREHAPKDVGPCDVAESVIGRPQNTSSWTGSEAMRFALEFFASAQSYVCTHLRASPELGSLFPCSLR